MVHSTVSVGSSNRELYFKVNKFEVFGCINLPLMNLFKWKKRTAVPINCFGYEIIEHFQKRVLKLLLGSSNHQYLRQRYKDLYCYVWISIKWSVKNIFSNTKQQIHQVRVCWKCECVCFYGSYSYHGLVRHIWRFVLTFSTCQIQIQIDMFRYMSCLISDS